MNEEKYKVEVPSGFTPIAEEVVPYNQDMAPMYLDSNSLSNVLVQNITSILQSLDHYFQVRGKVSIFSRTDYQVQTKELPCIAGSGDTAFTGYRDITTETLIINKLNGKAIQIKMSGATVGIKVAFQPSAVVGPNNIYTVGVPEIICEAQVDIFMFPVFAGQVFNYLESGIIDTDFSFSKPIYH